MTSTEGKAPEKPIRSFVDFIFLTPDTENTAAKTSVVTYLGCQIGGALSCAGVLLRKDVNFSQILTQRKLWAVGQIGIGVFVGGLSGLLYTTTVQQTSKLRGGKDDWINHFVGGFSAVLPYSAIYKRNVKHLLLGGTLLGMAFSLSKICTQSDKMRKNYMNSEREVKLHTRYPELFVCYEARKERYDAKQKMKEIIEGTS